MPIVPCDNCGKPLDRQPYRLKKFKHQFCNFTCKGEWQSKHTTGEMHPNWKPKNRTDCAHCGNPVKIHDYRYHPGENYFCGFDCYGKWRSDNMQGDKNGNYKGRMTVPCDWCGEQLERLPSKLNEWNFCDNRCRGDWLSANVRGEDHPLYLGGRVRDYGPNWQQQRRRARKRDDYTCQRCGITERELGHQLDVHHIKPFREFGYRHGENNNYKQANAVHNLICLCPSCHVHAENGTIPIQSKLL